MRALLLVSQMILIACSDAGFNSAVRISRQDNAEKAGAGSDKDKDKDKEPDQEGEQGLKPGTDGDDGSGGDDDKGGDADKDDENESGDKADEVKFTADDPTVTTSDGVVQVKRCSTNHIIPGKSNPYLAGMPSGSSIDYSVPDELNTFDRAPAQSPVQIIPTDARCLKAGATLLFEASGTIQHGDTVASSSNADGRMDRIRTHSKGAINGLSSIRAPINALLGVFIGSGAPSSATPPPYLSYDGAEQRDRALFRPKLNQVFYIGDGKAGGNMQKIIVPSGTKRLFLGVMDGRDWADNTGQLAGGILWQP